MDYSMYLESIVTVGIRWQSIVRERCQDSNKENLRSFYSLYPVQENRSCEFLTPFWSLSFCIIPKHGKSPIKSHIRSIRTYISVYGLNVNIWCPPSISNEDLWEITNQQPVTLYIKVRKESGNWLDTFLESSRNLKARASQNYFEDDHWERSFEGRGNMQWSENHLKRFTDVYAVWWWWQVRSPRTVTLHYFHEVQTTPSNLKRYTV